MSAPRGPGDHVHKEFYPEIARPVFMAPGADLMLLHPDGSEEVLVRGGEKGAVQDPVDQLRRKMGLLLHAARCEHGGTVRDSARRRPTSIR